jgi:hypothetical protein
MTLARSSIIARVSRSGSRPTDAGGVAAHEIHLQLAEARARDGDLGELAEPGRHAVRDGTRLDERGDDRVGLSHSRAGHGGQLDRGTLARHRDDVVERERLPIETTAAGMRAMSRTRRDNSRVQRGGGAPQRSPIPSLR